MALNDATHESNDYEEVKIEYVDDPVEENREEEKPKKNVGKMVVKTVAKAARDSLAIVGGVFLIKRLIANIKERKRINAELAALKENADNADSTTN